MVAGAGADVMMLMMVVVVSSILVGFGLDRYVKNVSKFKELRWVNFTVCKFLLKKILKQIPSLVRDMHAEVLVDKVTDVATLNERKSSDEWING